MVARTKKSKLDMVACTCDLSTQQAEAGGSRVQSQLGLHCKKRMKSKCLRELRRECKRQEELRQGSGWGCPPGGLHGPLGHPQMRPMLRSQEQPRSAGLPTGCESHLRVAKPCPRWGRGLTNLRNSAREGHRPSGPGRELTCPWDWSWPLKALG
jgi:hypothetical protein